MGSDGLYAGGARRAPRPRPAGAPPARDLADPADLAEPPVPTRPAEPGMDAVARAELRRSRHAVFGADGPAPEMAAFAGRVAAAVGDREPFVPAPSGPLGSAPLPAVRRPLPAPHEVVGPGDRAGRIPDGPAPSGPESVPLPSAPALVCDGTDRIVRVNPALLALAGRAAEGAAGLFGMRLPQLVVGPDSDARLVRPDGGLVRVRVLRWDVPGGELRAVVLVELDPTADEERTAQRHRVDALERLTGAGTWTYELASGTLRRSTALEELYRAVGLDPEARAERAAVESDLVARLCATLRAGAPSRGHLVQLELPGGQRLACRADVEYGPDGAPVRLVGVVRDIGAERAAQDRVKRSGQRFDDLVAALPGGVAIVDPGGRIVEANAALAALLDTPVERLRGRPVAAVAVDPSGQRPAGAFPEWLRLIRPGARHGYTVESVPLRRGDGSTAWADLRVTVTTSDDGGWSWMVVCTDLTESRQAAADLRRAAEVDALTGLPTRAGAVELLEALMVGPGRGTVAVVCAGIDDFRRVNSSLGHAAGDAALAALADRLRAELPAGCTAARLSGDEFVVVCADHRSHRPTGRQGTGEPADLARTVAAVLSGATFVDGRAVRLSASAGVAAGVVGRRTTAADLLRFAEIAMHDAKRRGTRVAVATEELVGAAGAALELETGLRTALGGGGAPAARGPARREARPPAAPGGLGAGAARAARLGGGDAAP
ncbi:MAG: diguanylate cyclase domain-containing protein, partial [Pseudonocardia sp.]